MNWITYFIVTGLIVATDCYRNYNNIIKKNSLIESIGVEVFVLVNFLFGFITIWIVLPLIIRDCYLSLKIKWIKRREEIAQTEHDRKAIQQCIELGQDLREVRKQLEEKYGPHEYRYKNIDKMIEEYERNKK